MLRATSVWRGPKHLGDGEILRRTQAALRKAVTGLALAGAIACARPGGDASPTPCRPVELGPVRFERMALWRDDARGAYSIIHDDACGWGLDGIQNLAVPALTRRGLRAGLAAIVRECEEQRLWPVLRAAQAQGHEIISHSYTHERVTPGNAGREVIAAKTVLERHLRRPILFYAFPFDVFGPETLAIVARSGHQGARGGDRDDNDGFQNPPINPAEPGHELEVEFDVWPRGYSRYTHFRELDLLNVHAWNAIERRGWAVREFHTVLRDDQRAEPAWFGPIRLSTYEKHLDFLVAARDRNLLWVDTPSNVLRYRRARQACRARVEGHRIVFDAEGVPCRAFATPLSVIVSTEASLPGLAARQDGRPVNVRKLAAGTYSVTADPTRGHVMLRGCANESPAVAAPPLPPRPTPVASVCDIETVMGTVDGRRIDDLERPGAFQRSLEDSSLPGALATWTWYPDAATGERFREGEQAVVRFAGEALGTWTGLTLGFVGAAGDASCHDARAHRGVRFRIRGSVHSDDELDGKVIFNLVTAETRTQRYGGDLAGEGGQFHRLLALTSDWQAVEIPWRDLQKPTWGATAGFGEPAAGKLLALEWSISNRASRFEVFVDDVEFF